MILFCSVENEISLKHLQGLNICVIIYYYIFQSAQREEIQLLEATTASNPELAKVWHGLYASCKLMEFDK